MWEVKSNFLTINSLSFCEMKLMDLKCRLFPRPLDKGLHGELIERLYFAGKVGFSKKTLLGCHRARQAPLSV